MPPINQRWLQPGKRRGGKKRKDSDDDGDGEVDMYQF